ncbi:MULTISPECIES: hypothetical protein [Pseudomonas]|uniref:hypothetical protein n=1 Tax=Pseudomonas TaxID=286 RepID=UPI0023D834A0|nr:hypothetical protein [Pseudomonas sp. 273]
MSSILHIRAVSHELPAFVARLEALGIDSLSLRQMSDEHFAGRSAILVEGHVDQRALLTHRDALRRHLDAGGTLVFNGHLVYPIFDGLADFVVAPRRGVKELEVERVNPHPVFDGVDCHDLSYRRGVAGFYARGANPPPPGAVVLHRLRADGSPIDWVWQRPDGGQVFMHSGNNLWMYINDDTSAARIAPQLLDWVRAGAPAVTYAEQE